MTPLSSSLSSSLFLCQVLSKYLQSRQQDFLDWQLQPIFECLMQTLIKHIHLHVRLTNMIGIYSSALYILSLHYNMITQRDTVDYSRLHCCEAQRSDYFGTVEVSSISDLLICRQGRVREVP